MIESSPLAANRGQIAYWLLVCCILVFAMVVLGGVTRLTGSGLSMVEWQPVFGILPPLSQVDWQILFEKYQQTPEFRHVNVGMDIDGFKGIFWLEYWHRILGRLIGIVFFVPFMVFWLRRKIEPGLAPKLLIMFVLGGAQGLLGWYMVKSGLVDNPYVSQYRLSAHLLLAVLVYGYMLWTAFALLGANAVQAVDRTLMRFSFVLLIFISVTIASGGFVAGLKAGLTYNTFPLMAGQWVPDGILNLSPWYRNFFENVATVQFDHRLLAMLTVLMVIFFWLRARRSQFAPVRGAGHVLLVAALLQMGLGIATLLLQVPVALGSLHQAGALLLFSVIVFIAQRLHAAASAGSAPQPAYSLRNSGAAF